MKITPDWLNWPEIQTLIKAYGEDSGKLRFVGGAVRDALLGIEVQDVDAATVFTPDETIVLLERSGIRVIPTGLKHGTVTAHIGGKNFEITTLRRDTSCDGRHAEVEFTTDWKEDAARRDFTMNSLYMSVEGKVFDYFGGTADAIEGRVKFIGNAYDRVQEDYLRILRFFRFYAWYGKTRADSEALDASRNHAAKIATLSGERIQHEMLKLLAAPAPLAALSLMQPYILEEVFCFKTQLLYNLNNEADNVALRLSLLLLTANKPAAAALDILAECWHISGSLKKNLQLIINNITEITPDLPVARQKHFLRKLGVEVFLQLVTLRYWLTPSENLEAMFALVENWQMPIMPVTGKDLIKLGTPEGKPLGEKLRKLEEAWEASDYKLTKEELLSSRT